MSGWDKAGEAWGDRGLDWAYLFEPYARAANDEVFDQVGIGPGIRLLDVACGSGYAVMVAADRGAEVSGLDAAPGLIEIARRRGGRMPLHATGVGLCLLANAPTRVQIDALEGDLRLAPENRQLSGGELRGRLAAVRRDGVAVVSRPYPSPMTSVAAPIFGRNDAILAALSVVTPSVDVDPVALRPAVTAVCRAISRAMRAD